MVHANNTDAEDGADEGIGGSSASLKQIRPDLRANGTLRSDSAKSGYFLTSRSMARLRKKAELKNSGGDTLKRQHVA